MIVSNIQAKASAIKLFDFLWQLSRSYRRCLLKAMFGCPQLTLLNFPKCLENNLKCSGHL